MHRVTPFQRKQYRMEGKRVNSQWRNLTNVTSDDQGQLPQWEVMLIVCTPDMMYNENGTFISVVFFPKSLSPSLILRKTPDKSHWGTFDEVPDQYSENCQGHKKQEKSEKLSETRGASGNTTTKYKGLSCMGSWKRKRKLGKSKGNLNKIWASLNKTVLIWVH